MGHKVLSLVDCYAGFQYTSELQATLSICQA